jgi:hypothetical protein
MQYISTSTVDNNVLNNKIEVTQWCTSSTDEVSQYNKALNAAQNNMIAALYNEANTARCENSFVANSISNSTFNTSSNAKKINQKIIASIKTYSN